jgi:hypothetical protein
LDEAVARGRDAQAVQQWENISPLLTEDVLATYNQRIARLTQEIETLNTKIQNLKATVNDGGQRYREADRNFWGKSIPSFLLPSPIEKGPAERGRGSIHSIISR